MIVPISDIESIQWICPACGSDLHRAVDDALVCAGERAFYRKIDGVWEMLSSERASYFRRFVTEYDEVRRRERRGSPDGEYYRRLPYEDTTGRHARDWQIRAASFECLLENVLSPLEGRAAPVRQVPASPDAQAPSSRPLRILDVGAGNGWMSNRLAQRGHEVWAVDLRRSPTDGLGARVHYESKFTCVRAEFDRLPFGRATFDLIIFNASLHYAESYEQTLKEALRVLRPGGRVVVADTALYDDAGSGERMVQTRKEAFRRVYGFASDALRSEEYLTPSRLRLMSARLGITWSVFEPEFGLRWAVRRIVARLRNRREPARFVVLSGRTDLSANEAVARMAPLRRRVAVGRLGLRLHFITRQRRRLRRDVVERFHGLKLRIPSGIFHPIIFRTGAFLAELILDDLIPTRRHVLDLGAGSGICAVAAAARGARVTAVDINPHAVSATRENADLNGVRIRTLQTDLFDGVGRFDVVLFNPPYFAGKPASSFDLAWRSDDLVERFSRELSAHLTADGYALVVLSSDGRGDEYLRRFEVDGHRLTLVAERRYLSETLSVFRIR